MFSLKTNELINKKFTWRGLAIALCMCFYDWRYLWIGNLSARMHVIHCWTDYLQVNTPILKAAKHCADHWCGFICYNMLHDNYEGMKKAMHYYKT